MARVRGVKDDEIQLLIECFTAEEEGSESIRHKFSEKFLEVLVKIIREKRDRF